jgi:hypothetical protein
MTASEKNFAASTANTAHYQASHLKRAVWLKQLHQWHWISSALCLLCMLMFSFTGITLNHASQIEAKPKVTNRKAVLPAPLQDDLRRFAAGVDADHAKPPLPDAVIRWIAENMAVRTGSTPAEWSIDEAYVPLPRPGGDAWLRIGLADGAIEYELTERGWISWLNDLHKGRNTGPAWNWFIDVFAVSCLVFALTGLLILKFHATARRSTWPVVGLGVLVPLLLVLLFLH